MRYPIIDYTVIVLFCLVLVWIGFHFSKERKSSLGYLLGGRGMGYLSVGISCVMSMLSSVTLVMIPGEIVNYGLTYFLLSPIATLLGIPCYLIFIRFYFQLGSFTPYEYLEYRYDAKIRAAVAFVAFYFRILFVASVLYTTAKIFEVTYNWNPFFTVVLVGGIGLLYTIVGGSKAVIWSDIFQFFVLFGTFAVVLIVMCCKIDGGAWGAITTAFAQGRGAKEFTEPDFYKVTPYIRLMFWIMLWGTLTSPLVKACSDQITIQRLLSTANWREGFKANVFACVINTLVTFLLWFTGLAVFTYYFQNPELSPGQGQGDKALFAFVTQTLPTPLPGLFIAGMLAAIISTVAGVSQSLATLYMKEFHQKFFNRNLDQKGEVRVTMWATALIGLFSMGFGFALEFSARWLNQSVTEVQTLFNFLGVIVFPAFIFAVLSRRASSALIWGYALYCLGESVANEVWYALSRSSVLAWKADPSLGFGWGDKFAFTNALPFYAAGILLLLPTLIKALRSYRWAKVCRYVALPFLGAGQTLLLWATFSNIYVKDVPLEKSFAFSLPISFIGAFILLWFMPVQERKKYQGLTLSTMGQEIEALKKDKENATDK